MTDPVYSRLLSLDEELNFIDRWSSLARFCETVSNALPKWTNENECGPIGVWEIERKALIIEALLEQSEYLEVVHFDGENKGWQLFPTKHLALFSYPDLETGFVPHRNFLLRQIPQFEIVEGRKIYIDGHIADAAFATITKDIDLIPKVASEEVPRDKKGKADKYREVYVTQMLESSPRPPTVTKRVDWLRKNFNMTRDRARELEKSNRPDEWDRMGRPSK